MLQSIVLPRVDLKQIQKLAGQIPLGLGAGEILCDSICPLRARRSL